MVNPFESLETQLQDLKKLMVTLQSQIQTPQPLKQTKFLTREDVASLLQISESTVFNWTKSGILKAYQCGGRIFYKLHEIEASMIELKK